jgi:murein L,D-transpeptidase YcbB/YkuD
MTIRSRHIPVMVDAETYEAVKSFSEISGIPATRVVAEAIKEWLNTTGAAKLAALQILKKKPNQ